MLLIKPGAQKANNTHCTDDRTAGFKSSCASVQINGMLLISMCVICVCAWFIIVIHLRTHVRLHLDKLKCVSHALKASLNLLVFLGRQFQ